MSQKHALFFFQLLLYLFLVLTNRSIQKTFMLPRYHDVLKHYKNRNIARNVHIVKSKIFGKTPFHILCILWALSKIAQASETLEDVEANIQIGTKNTSRNSKFVILGGNRETIEIRIPKAAKIAYGPTWQYFFCFFFAIVCFVRDNCFLWFILVLYFYKYV